MTAQMELVITRHAKDQAKKRFGFTEQDIYDIINKNDKLTETEKHIVWFARNSRKTKVKNTDDYFYDNGIVVVVTDGHVITIYEAKYIQFDRDRNFASTMIQPEHTCVRTRSKDFVSKEREQRYYQLFQEGHSILVKGKKKELYIERGMVGFDLDGTFKPLCHFWEKHIKCEIPKKELREVS